MNPIGHAGGAFLHLRSMLSPTGIGAFALGSMLVLSACSGSSTGVSRSDLRAAEEKAESEAAKAAAAARAEAEAQARAEAEKARANAAEGRMAALRESLAAAQNALAAAAAPEPGPAAREAVRKVVGDARQDLGQIRMELEEQPVADADAGAKAAVEEALEAVDLALQRTLEALAGANLMVSGQLVFADMHTSLDQAQNALADAQAKLTAALEEDPPPALTALLVQAQAMVSTAQISLVPVLREDLAEAEAAAAAAEAAAEAAEAKAAAAARAEAEAQARAEAEAAKAAAAARAEAEAQARAEAEAAKAAAAARAEAEAQARAEAEAAKAAAAARAEAEAQARAEAEAEARAEAEAEAAAQQARADTYDPRVPLAQALEPGATRFVPRGEVEITRTARTDTGEEGWEKLDIATGAVAFAAGKRVGVEDGGGLVPTDELPLRAVALRAHGRHPINIQGDDGTPDAYGNTDGVVTSSLQLSADGATLKLGGTGVLYYDSQRRFDIGGEKDAWASTGPDGKVGDADASVGDTMTAEHAADLELESASGTLTAAHATALIGYALDNPSHFGADRKQGDASAAADVPMTVAHAADLGLDEPSGALDADQAAMLVRYAEDNSPTAACWQEDLSLCGDWNQDDLTIAFGAPSQSPHGEPAYYWKAKVPLTEAQLEQLPLPWGQGPDAPTEGRRPIELGTYELWLSNYGGLDTGADADDASDDTHRYLEYAAHGLFMFFDNVKALPSFTRVQAFAFGYDAFADADSMRTAERFPTSIAATFQGHTMARYLENADQPDHIILNGALPIRGDITLNACIGGSSCTGDGPTTANTISGMISGLEELRHDGQWIPYLPAAGGIPMEEGVIAADGSFGGPLDHPRIASGDPNTWHFAGEHPSSKYGGNLYGPGSALEAAGWWHVQPDNRTPRLDSAGRRALSYRARNSSLIGSFGAKCIEGCAPEN